MAARSNPKKNGRPTTYRAEYARLGFWMAQAGKTNEEIAAELGVAESTFYCWLKKHPKFTEALKAGREEPDRLVEQSLFQRAIGYDYEEVKIITGDNPRTETTMKQKAPDVVAQIFWLKNRRPDRWRDKQEHSHTINGPLVIQRSDKDG
jgi:hypothetical protein